MTGMLGLLRSDVYRLLRGRKLWVMHALVLAGAAFVLFAAWLEANGGEIQVDSYGGESSISSNVAVTYATHGDMFARLGFAGVWMSMMTVLAVLIAIEDSTRVSPRTSSPAVPVGADESDTSLRNWCC